MKKILFTAGLGIFFAAAMAQNVGVGIAAPHNSAQLDISSTARGLLIPRMTSTGIAAIASPAKGLMVYDSLNNQLMVNMGSAATPNWQTIVFNSGWNLTGNNGTNPASQFIGSTDNQSLRFRVNNMPVGELNPAGNIFWGLRAGQNNTTAYSNVAIGTDALRKNTTGLELTAIGDSALFNNNPNSVLNGLSNTAVGYQALFSSATGNYNTAVGARTLRENTTGYYNTALGTQALAANTIGGSNTGIGAYSLLSNETGIENTAVGNEAGSSNSTGNYNTGLGHQALWRNTTGSSNIAIGVLSMAFSATGSSNVAVGNSALYHNTGSLGSFNTAIGEAALYNTTGSQYNTAVGYQAGLSHDLGYNNTILGANCQLAADGLFNCIAIGQQVTCTASSQARIGNLATNSIGGTVGWSTLSDGRYKTDLEDNVKGIDFIMKLRPLTYRLNLTALNNRLNEMTGRKKSTADAGARQALSQKESTIFSGFVAQDVEQAAKESGYAFSGVDKPQNENDLYGLRYGDFVVPLVKAVQEQQVTIQQQQILIEELQKRLQALENKIK